MVRALSLYLSGSWFESKQADQHLASNTMIDHTQAPIIVAIDGTSGSGKSALAKGLAQKLGFHHLNSGLVYRVVAVEIAEKIESDPAGCIEFLENASVEYLPDQHMTLNGKDITPLAYSAYADRVTPGVAKIPAVREIVRVWQRHIAAGWGDSVVEGRDIGTVVFPDAQIKIYLQADIEKRAQWRYLQRKKKGAEEPLDEIRQALQERDAADIERPESGLRPAPDAYLLDASLKTQSEVLDEAFGVVQRALGR